ncbi:MAG: manganese efflux pump [Candidatus Bathyarchaeota archaeon]|nr:manganese efflux pump [Candidatus Bathyarchaeota archaeon]
MQFVETLLLSLALIIDSFTIAVSFGLVETKATFLKNMNIVGLTCAIGQVFFIAVGWWLGSFIAQFIVGIGPWAGFALLTLLSIYLVIDALKKRKNSVMPYRHLGLKIILFLVIATSFDVLSVGITLGLLEESIWILMIVLWVFTYFSAYAGGFAGFKIGEKIGVYKGQIFGAALLFLLGLSLLLQNI